jgi:hypothetical protein
MPEVPELIITFDSAKTDLGPIRRLSNVSRHRLGRHNRLGATHYPSGCLPTPKLRECPSLLLPDRLGRGLSGRALWLCTWQRHPSHRRTPPHGDAARPQAGPCSADAAPAPAPDAGGAAHSGPDAPPGRGWPRRWARQESTARHAAAAEPRGPAAARLGASPLRPRRRGGSSSPRARPWRGARLRGRAGRRRRRLRAAVRGYCPVGWWRR